MNYITPVMGVIALIYAFIMAKKVKRADRGTPHMG